MALIIRTMHPASSPELLNEEWLLLENTGPGLIQTAGLGLHVGRAGQRPRSLGTLSPGFVLQSGERIRLVTGSPSKKAWGAPPAEESGIKNYFLFLREPVLARPGLVVSLALHQHELARARFAPDQPDGVAAP